MGGCTAGPQSPRPDDPGPGQHSADVADLAPGTLLTSWPDPSVDIRISRAHASSTQITYRSTSGLDGSATTVTGAVFTPTTEPPPDGWPVVVYGHPGAGILENCAPSRQSNLFGNGAAIESLLREGFLVVMTDYQGIGSTGPHPYLEPRTLGYNMIDAVRAARQLQPDAGSRWAAYGASEGGEAAWAAAALAPSYGQGLTMVAAVALNPTADMSALPQLALNGQMSPQQLSVLLYLANTAASIFPDVKLDDYVRGYTREHNDALMGCSPRDLYTRATLMHGMSAQDLMPVSPEAAERLSSILRDWSVPGTWGTAQVPILVVAGALDTVVWPQWTAARVQAACAAGEQITWLPRPTEGHDNLQQRQALSWLTIELKGLPVDDSVTPAQDATCNAS